MSIRQSRRLLQTSTNTLEVCLLDRHIYLIEQLEDTRSHLRVLNAIIDRIGIPVESESSIENIVDIPGDGTDERSAGSSAYPMEGQRLTLDMGDFLSRPVQLLEQTLALSTDINIRLKVWDLFFLAPSVRAKTRNFAYFKGNLNVRIAVSGSPFHYGRLLVSYQPYAAYNQNLVQHAAALTANWRPLMLNYLSQAPGATVINVNENKPLDLECPFIAPKPMHRLFNFASTTISGVTSFDDLKNAGDLFIYSLNQAKAVSATPSSLYIQVYAWVDKAELGTNTATLMDITTESGTYKKPASKKDERKTGPVENVASRALEISQALEVVPSIGFMAKASSIALGALTHLAAHFGWSRPSLIAQPVIVKLEPFQNGAQTIGTETIQRITLDPQQELTVDPSITGDTEDNMTIAHIARRVSYYTTFTWAPGSTIMGNPIHIANVTPCLGSKATVAATKYIQPTALCYSALPFAYWRGDITFRFEVVCSAFHRGKLAVIWEPNIAQNSSIVANFSYNKQYVRIVDIQETHTFEVTVQWGSYRSWLLCSTAAGVENSQGGLFTFPIGLANGFIAVTPFTQLQSPDGSSVSINAYVYSTNMRYNQLTATNVPTKRGTGLTMAFGDVGPIPVESASDIVTEHVGVSNPTSPKELMLNESTANTMGISELYFGEQPVSFRTLMKRYVTNYSGAVGAWGVANTYYAHYLTRPIIPINGMPYGSTSVAIVDLYSYLKYAYLGQRGGYRYRIHYSALLEGGPLSQTRVARRGLESADVTASTTTTNAAMSTLEGTAMFVPQTVGGVEVEFPFYSNNMFVFSFSDVAVPAAAIATNEMEGTYTRNFDVFVESIGYNPAGWATLDFAAAEDFCFLRFQGAPFYSF